MTPEQFTYWLQGYSEIAGAAPSSEQWEVIQDHLATVFDKQTPDRATPAVPTDVQWSPAKYTETNVIC